MVEKKKKDKIIIMSIMSYYARQIFEETKPYEFRKSFLKPEDLNKKIYIYSAKEDKAIIGYVKVDDMLKGNTNEILHLTGYDKRPDGHEIVEYYGQNFQRCVALHLYDVTEFDDYLSLAMLRRVKPSIQLPQYYSYIYEGDPLYNLILEWDKAYAIDGQPKEDPKSIQRMTMKRKGK